MDDNTLRVLQDLHAKLCRSLADCKHMARDAALTAVIEEDEDAAVRAKIYNAKADAYHTTTVWVEQLMAGSAKVAKSDDC